jgi:ribonuclease HI
MAKNAKYYVVWVGAKPGVYDTWKACEAQVRGYPDARYKSFPTRKEAESAFRDSAHAHIKPRSTGSVRRSVHAKSEASGIIAHSISVDAACSGNPGVMEYRGVRTDTKEELFHMGPFPEGTNNIGEFLAIVHALAMLAAKGDSTTPIYSDSRIAQGWIKGGTAKTKLERNRKTQKLFELITRAENWLKTHTWKNPILKWETKHWGEIPADFGRK